METTPHEPQPRPARLRVGDTVSIIVGVIIGVGIFQTPSSVFANTPGLWVALGIWLLGGLISLLGAFCFAELATTYPRSGGEYNYLTRAYGPMAGFLFAWAQLAVIRTAGSIAAVAYIFALYAAKLFGLSEGSAVLHSLVAAAAIILLTAVNVLGVRLGARTQNALTVVKVLALGLILVAGFAFAGPEALVAREGRFVGLSGNELRLHTADGVIVQQVAPDAGVVIDGATKDVAGQRHGLGALEPGMTVKALLNPERPEAGAVLVRASTATLFGGLALALILVLWTYAGWHEGGYVAAEVENPRRNLPRALFLGTGVVTLLYVLVNAALAWGGGYEAAASAAPDRLPAADVLGLIAGAGGERLMCALVVVSALGAINGMIFTSARIFVVFGEDHRLFAPLAGWSPRFGTPVRALTVQAAVSVATVAVVGLAFRGKDSFETLVYATSPVFCVFFMLTGLALIVLRKKEPNQERPFVTPLYPLLPLLFVGVWAAMLVSSVRYKPLESAVGLGVLLLGVPLYFLSRDWEGIKKRDFVPAVPPRLTSPSRGPGAVSPP
jgi:amino acid transporter